MYIYVYIYMYIYTHTNWGTIDIDELVRHEGSGINRP